MWNRSCADVAGEERRVRLDARGEPLVPETARRRLGTEPQRISWGFVCLFVFGSEFSHFQVEFPTSARVRLNGVSCEGAERSEPAATSRCAFAGIAHEAVEAFVDLPPRHASVPHGSVV